MNPFAKSAQPGPSRRKFLGASLAGTAVGLLGAASSTFIATEPVFAQSILTPDQALKALMDGNERFMAGNILSDAQDLKILREHTVEKQEPFAAVLACADSRVPVELIFDQSIGTCFSRASRATSLLLRSLPVSNSAPLFWALKQSLSSGTPAAEL